MEDLKPIPTPAAQRWREFRVQALPVLTFIGVVTCITLLWQRYVFPSNIIAQVEPITSAVVSPENGTLQELKVARFQTVKKGDPIAIVSITESNLVAATMATVQAELDLMRARIDIGQLRAQQTYERERLAFLEQQVQLNIDREKLKLAEAQFKRAQEMMANKPPLISTNDYEVAYFNLTSLQVSVRETEKFLEERARILPTLQADTNSMAFVEASVRAQQSMVLATTTNLTLYAPMDGIITAVSNRPGETVISGRPIVTISGSQPERIIAYMRQPVTNPPKPGDTLQVRRRTFKRQMAIATVAEVGTQIEPIAPTLLPAFGATARIDFGLPFAITLPPQLALLPGEIVDVIYEPKKN